jgi:hypothetical protein
MEFKLFLIASNPEIFELESNLSDVTVKVQPS